MIQGIPISQLGAATLPLTGTELVPVVQGGVTKSAPASAFGGGSGVAVQALAIGANDNVVIATIEDIVRVAFTLTGDSELSGIVPPAVPDGRRLMIVNRSAFLLTILSNVTSVATNRFVSNGDILVPPLCGAEYIYDSGNQRWVKT